MGVKRKKTTKIILHCSAEPEGRTSTTVDTITKWHKSRGFSTIGYHYVIYHDGSIHEGRGVDEVGAHTVGENSVSIGICYLGGCDKNMKPKDTRTPEQREAMKKLINKLLVKYNLTPDDLYGHNDFAKKACPSFDVKKYRILFI